MAKINFGGTIEEVVTREEFPLNKALEYLKDETIAAASAKAAEGHSVLSDHFVSEEYRRAMAQVYAKRALTKLS